MKAMCSCYDPEARHTILLAFAFVTTKKERCMRKCETCNPVTPNRKMVIFAFVDIAINYVHSGFFVLINPFFACDFHCSVHY